MSAHDLETLLGAGMLAAAFLGACYWLPFAIVRRGDR